MNSLGATEIVRKSGSEAFEMNGEKKSFCLSEFWEWSGSDLVNNTQRGILAEFIVAKALGLDRGVRTEWDAYDLLTESGVKVEIKSAAYIQSWAQKDYSKIQFSIKPTIGWDAKTNTYSEVVQRQSDVYVFCLLKHKDQESLNPLDLGQWEFYVVKTEHINERLGNQGSISFSALLKLDHECVGYDGLEGVA